MLIKGIPVNQERRYTSFPYQPGGTDSKSLPRSHPIRRIVFELQASYVGATAPLSDTPQALIQEIKILGDGDPIRRIYPPHCYNTNYISKGALPPRTPVIVGAGVADCWFAVDFEPGELNNPAETRLAAGDYDNVDIQVIWRTDAALDPTITITGATLFVNIVHKLEDEGESVEMSSLLGDDWNDKTGLVVGANTIDLLSGYFWRRIIAVFTDALMQPVDVADVSDVSVIKDGFHADMNLSSYYLRGMNGWTHHIDAITWPMGYLMFDFLGGDGKLSTLADTRRTQDFKLQFTLVGGTAITRVRLYYDRVIPAGIRNTSPDAAAKVRQVKMAHAMGVPTDQAKVILAGGSPEKQFRISVPVVNRGDVTMPLTPHEEAAAT